MDFDSYFTYLSSNTFDESWQMYCTTVGRVQVAPDGQYPYAKSEHPKEYTSDWEEGRILNEYQCLYISEGRGSFSCMGKTYPVGSGTVIFLFPEVKHYYKPDPLTGWIERWVGFKGSYPDTLFKTGHLSFDMMVLHIGYQESIVKIYDDIIEQARNETFHSQQILSALVLLLIAKIKSLKHLENNFQTHEIEVINRAKLLFHEHLFTTLDIESTTEQLSMNYKQFRELFKAYTGYTPYQYFLNLKINKAKEMLSEGKLTVKEISYKLAFDNPYYFSRLFKKKTGVSPSRWNGANNPTGMNYLE